jgi:hypothetical protein
MSSTDKVKSKTDENAEPVANNAQQTSSADSKPSTANTVCRFRISQLRGGGGYAKNDYFVDLVTSKHGLLDLVMIVFDILRREKLTSDQFYSHLWYLNFNNTKYAYGWRNGTGGGVTVSNHLDEQEPRLLNTLPPLEKGQKGSFGGESANFDGKNAVRFGK